MAGKLGSIMWLEGLGSLAEKASRIEALALWMASASGIEDEKLERNIRRSALLAKADLASEMVKDGKEFTALQGYIGREYARVSGEGEEVAEAIYEHYLPRFAADRMPHGETSALLALADKIDTITGCFVMGLEPSGSQDPYALRRHASGVLRILIARRSALPLPKVLDRSIGLFEHALKGAPRGRGELLAQLREFYAQRLNTIVRGEGVDHDLAAAVLASPWEYPHAVKDMADELASLRKSAELSAFVMAMKRVTNIIPRTLRDGYTEDLFFERAHPGLGRRRRRRRPQERGSDRYGALGVVLAGIALDTLVANILLTDVVAAIVPAAARSKQDGADAMLANNALKSRVAGRTGAASAVGEAPDIFRSVRAGDLAQAQ